MSSVSEKWFAAMEEIAYKVINGVPKDLTVMAQVELVQNVEIGQYRVRYQSDTMTAYSLNPQTVYDVGEGVYMLVPRGDFSARKLILGSSSGHSGSSFEERQNQMVQWATIGPNWLSPEWYWRTVEGEARSDPRDTGIVALHPDDLMAIDPPVLPEDPAWRGELFVRNPSFEEFDAYRGIALPSDDEQDRTRPPAHMMSVDGLRAVDVLFGSLANRLEHFQVRADFETMFSKSHSTGEYGLLIECLVKNPRYGQDGQDDEPFAQHPFLIATFKFRSLDFNGNPYQFNVPTPQSMVFALPKGALRGLVRVALYQDNGFATDVAPHYNTTVLPRPDPDPDPDAPDTYRTDIIWEPPDATLITDINNIKVTNVQIHFVQQIHLTRSLYHVRVESPQTGIGVNANNLNARLEAHLYYGETRLTSEETCRFYWFREKVDADITKAAGRLGGIGTNDHDEFGRNWHAYGGNGWAPIAWPFPNNQFRVGLAYRAPGVTPGPGGTWASDNHAFGQWPGNSAPGILTPNYVVEALNVPRPENLTERPNDLPAPLPARRAAFNHLVVPIERVPWRWRYKVVCVYNGVAPGEGSDERPAEVVISNEQSDPEFLQSTVINLDSPFDFELPDPVVGMSGNNTFLRVLNNRLPWEDPGYPMFDETQDPFPGTDWWARWWWTGDARTIIGHEGDQYRQGKIKINQFLFNSVMHFAAQIYAPVGGWPVPENPAWTPPPPQPQVPIVLPPVPEPANANFIIPPNQGIEYIEIGTVYLTLFPPGDAPFIVTFNGPTQFNFFADGTSKLRDWRELHQITANIVWKPGQAATHTVEWIAPTREVVTQPQFGDLEHAEGRGISPDDSMMFDIWALSFGSENNRNTVNFRVKEFYDSTKKNNTLTFRIRLFDDRYYDFDVPITFIKDGSPGTTGAPWVANIWPVNSGIGLDQINHDPFRNKLYVPRPLRIAGVPGDATSPAAPTGSNNLPLHLRPHITKAGVPLEELPEVDGYSARVTWDVRYAGGSWDRHPCDTLDPVMQGVAGQSFLRITDANAAFNPNTTTLRQDWNPHGSGPISEFSAATIRVWWAGLNTINSVSLESLNFACIVRARIDIFRDDTLVSTIFDYYPVELLFVGNSGDAIVNQLMHVNWPQLVNYDAAGYNPQLDVNAPLRFTYGPRARYTRPPRPIPVEPTNLVDGVARLARITRTSFDHAEPEDREWRYEPFPHFLAAEWRFDSIRTTGMIDNPDLVDNDWGTAVFIRPVTYRLITHGNSSINAWDGQALVPGANSQGEVVLAPSVGAGWMNPATNTFTGVLMGINTSRARVNYDRVFGGFPVAGGPDTTPFSGIPGQQWVTGIFGYQNGFSSFGIMENGIAYFGRADRGRIVLDGINGQIYGGGSTYGGIGGNDNPYPHGDDARGAPMPMWNRMRLSLIDFHRPRPPEYNEPNKPSLEYRPGDTLATTPGPAIDGFECSDGTEIKIRTAPLEVDPALWEYFSWASVNPTTRPQDDQYQEQESGTHGFAEGPGYSTPAIEIGQYDPEHIQKMVRVLNVCDVRNRSLAEHQNRPVIGEDDYNGVLNTLQIPGHRRFLVTYDGTMYAMNAFIKGNIIGSNIIGSQFFNWNGSFAVTERGNLGIGIAGEDWIASSVVRGGPGDEEGTQENYWELWSERMPYIREYNVSNYLRYDPEYYDEEDNSWNEANRNDFLGLGCGDPDQEPGEEEVNAFNFFVSNTGRVIARDLHVAGGSLNIGNFYITGEDPSNPDGRGGDVISFGTMYLVGIAEPPLGVGPNGDQAPWSVDPFGPDIKNALETWGNVYLRGNLANLGPVFLGSAIEKKHPLNEGYIRAGTDISGPPEWPIVPAALNSPISITPSRRDPFVTNNLTRDAIPNPLWATQMGIWPLYFHVLGNHPNYRLPPNPELSDHLNSNWVVMSIGNGELPNDQGDNGYMPGFANRAWNQIGRTNNFNSRGRLDPPVVWRVDQLGMWTDGIFWTHSEFASRVDNQTPMNIERDGLAFIGYVNTEGGFRNDDDIFLIKNASDRARGMNLESPVDIRVLAGQYENRRTGLTEVDSSHVNDSRVTLEAWSHFPSGGGDYRRGGVLAVEANGSDSDRLVGSAGSISFVAQSVNRGRVVQDTDIQAAIILNGIDFEGEMTDEGSGGSRTISHQARQTPWAEATNDHAPSHAPGRILMRGAAAALDFTTQLGQIQNVDVIDSSIRINRDFDGTHGVAAGDFPYGFGSDINVNIRTNNMVFRGWRQRLEGQFTGTDQTTPTFIINNWRRVLFASEHEVDRWNNPGIAANFPPAITQNGIQDLFASIFKHHVLAGHDMDSELWFIHDMAPPEQLEDSTTLAGIRIGPRANRSTFGGTRENSVNIVGEELTIAQRFGLRDAFEGPSEGAGMPSPPPSGAINITRDYFFITHTQDPGDTFIITNGVHGRRDPEENKEWMRIRDADSIIRFNTDELFEITTQMAGNIDIADRPLRTWFTLLGDPGQIVGNAGGENDDSMVAFTRNFVGGGWGGMHVDDAVQSIGIHINFTKTNHDELNIMQVGMDHVEELLYTDREWVRLSREDQTAHMNAETRSVVSVNTDSDCEVDGSNPWLYLQQDETNTSFRGNAWNEISLTLGSSGVADDTFNTTAIGTTPRAIGIHDVGMGDCIGTFAGVSHDENIVLVVRGAAGSGPEPETLSFMPLEDPAPGGTGNHGDQITEYDSWIRLGHGHLIQSASEQIGFTLGWDDPCTLNGMTNGIAITESRLYLLHENAILIWVDGAVGEIPDAAETWIKLYHTGSIRGNAAGAGGSSPDPTSALSSIAPFEEPPSSTGGNEISFTFDWGDVHSADGAHIAMGINMDLAGLTHDEQVIIRAGGVHESPLGSGDSWIRLFGTDTGGTGEGGDAISGGLRGNAPDEVSFTLDYEGDSSAGAHTEVIGIHPNFAGMTHGERIVIRTGGPHGDAAAEAITLTYAVIDMTQENVFITHPQTTTGDNLIISNGPFGQTEPDGNREWIRLRNRDGVGAVAGPGAMRLNAHNVLTLTNNVPGGQGFTATDNWFRLSRNNGNWVRGNVPQGGEIGFSVNFVGSGDNVNALQGASRGSGHISSNNRFVAVDDELYMYSNSSGAVIHDHDVVGTHQWFRMRSGNAGLTTINGGTGSVTLHVNSGDMVPASAYQPWLRINFPDRRAHMNGGGPDGLLLATLGRGEGESVIFSGQYRALAIEQDRLHIAHPTELYLLRGATTGNAVANTSGLFLDEDEVELRWSQHRFFRAAGVPAEVRMQESQNRWLYMNGTSTRLQDRPAVFLEMDVNGLILEGFAGRRFQISSADIRMQSSTGTHLVLTGNQLTLTGVTAVNQFGIAARFG